MDMGPRKSAFEPTKARHLVRRRRHRSEDPPALTVPDRSRGEVRLATMGLDSEGKLIVVAWIPREVGGRIVSARKATPRERRSYEEKS